MRFILLVLGLLWSVVEVQSQTEYPYISFMGKSLPNYSYVDLSLVGNDQDDSDSNTVQCHTDLDTCCRGDQGMHRGDWFAPVTDTRLPFPSEEGDIFEDRQDQVVHLLRRNNADGPSGIYRCIIATNAVNDDIDISVGETVYVRLIYASGEDLFLSLNDTFIPNHGYVVISDIGSTNDTALICHTSHIADIPNQSGTNSEGDWYTPDGTTVGNIGSTDVPGFGTNRGPMIVRLQNSRATDHPGLPSEGIYYCVVEDANQTVYVGLYNSGGGGDVMISGNITFILDSDLNVASPQFTLTCISTGGPATNVTWTRDSVPVSGDGMTVFNGDTTAPQYTHTLTVTGRLEGLYMCTAL